MLIREIEEKDNKEVETLIRTCLIEFGANKPGCAWSDPNLGCFYQVYQDQKSKYWVVEKDNKIIGGCGIGPLENTKNICELQKMYALKEARGTGIAKELLKISLDFAKKYYDKCYLETFNNMVAANKFYQKNGFVQLDKPILETEHYACDVWYVKSL
ncbi:GNAT family N-acetyltransferase [Clostridium chromiireducens]|uniref:Acetyltransferase (GNAT) family protein n=1 Tax=Clostridium chromiireducens TaxID=225345 RepID=A0A1V4IS66_9CLOT|nr:GNAT family N-acetyltransferase [Clostridium chromiireducens]OPJ62655.1 acetyltransferase (GNAT) family protein [Clostridium chromiireducens]RII33277.1 GNAT family N-acetyltransferase [Clostridium chromiireducens]